MLNCSSRRQAFVELDWWKSSLVVDVPLVASTSWAAVLQRSIRSNKSPALDITAQLPLLCLVIGLCTWSRLIVLVHQTLCGVKIELRGSIFDGCVRFDTGWCDSGRSLANCVLACTGLDQPGSPVSCVVWCCSLCPQLPLF